MRDVTREHIRRGNQAVEQTNIGGKENNGRWPPGNIESTFEARIHENMYEGTQVRNDGATEDGGGGKASPLQDLHSVNMEISRTMAQVESLVFAKRSRIDVPRYYSFTTGLTMFIASLHASREQNAKLDIDLT